MCGKKVDNFSLKTQAGLQKTTYTWYKKKAVRYFQIIARSLSTIRYFESKKHTPFYKVLV